MSYTRLIYHVVTATKGREPLISPEVEAVLFPAFQRKAMDLGGRLVRAGGVEDHVHLIVEIPPTVTVSDFVRALKAGSSRAVTKTCVIHSPFQWQSGYGCFTLSAHNLQAILAYVEKQKHHHAIHDLWPHFERITP